MDGLKQLDLVRPWLAVGLDAVVKLALGLLHPVQSVQDRPGQHGVVGIKIASNACARSGIFERILPLAKSASTRASVSPSIIAPAETVSSDDATVEGLIDASSIISSNDPFVLNVRVS